MREPGVKARKARSQSARPEAGGRREQTAVPAWSVVEHSLRRSQELLQRVFSSIDILIVSMDRTFTINQVNPAFARFWGKCPEEFLGANYLDLFPSGTIGRSFRKVVRTGESCVAYMVPFPGAGAGQGRGTFWDWGLQPVMGDAGRVEGVILSLVDVTARQRAEAEAEMGRAFRGALEESLLTGIVACDQRGRLLYVNPAFCRIVGWTRDELLGSKPPYPFWPPEDAHDLLQYFRSTSGSPPAQGRSMRFCRADGERFDVWVMVSRLNDPRGVVSGWVASVGDITAQTRSERALRDYASRLRSASSRLLSAEERERKRVSRELHDSIGQTLSALKYGLEEVVLELDRRGRGPEVRKKLDKAIALLGGAIGEVRTIVSDLRPSLLDDLGLVAAIGWFCREFQKMYRGIRVVTEIMVVEQDIPERLRSTFFRIVQESMNNVAKHSGADLVRLRVRLVGRSLEFVLTDNGRGFDVKNAQGGFGLVGMKERAELTGGACTVRSAPDRGTAVRVLWPLAEVNGGLS
jgi:PAS domain S-box-containing protein